MTVNGMPLTEPNPVTNLPKWIQPEGIIELAPGTCTFLVLDK